MVIGRKIDEGFLVVEILDFQLLGFYMIEAPSDSANFFIFIVWEKRRASSGEINTTPYLSLSYFTLSWYAAIVKSF